jgi:DNA-binding CsgD family transcriptional regulator
VSLGGAGIGVVLEEAVSGQAPAVAHVLPLGGGEARRALGQGAAAAVFVSAPAAPDGERLAAAMRSLGLTLAEVRLAERLAAGQTLTEARAALGIAETTAKTHLARIFEKAGVSRQQDLVALLARLASPLRGR